MCTASVDANANLSFVLDRICFFQTWAPDTVIFCREKTIKQQIGQRLPPKFVYVNTLWLKNLQFA